MQEYHKGQILSGRFSLIAPLGHGGMGDVWLAEDKEFSSRVAVKILKPALAANPDMVERLRKECSLIRKLVHPNITRVLDFFSSDDSHFFSMEYVEGDDLEAMAGRHYKDWLPMLFPVLEAVEYAHKAGMVHRDLKLKNVLIALDGTVKLSDFGIGGLSGDSAGIEGGGSPYSISPQQLDGDPAAVADDIYALGVMIYELLTGKPPFHPSIDHDKIRNEVPVPPQTDYPLPAGLTTLIMSMLAKIPAERPSSVAAVRNALADATGLGSTATLPPGEQPAAGNSEPDKITQIRRHAVAPVSADLSGTVDQDLLDRRPWIPGLIMAVLLLLAAAVFLYLPEQVAKRKPDQTLTASPESGLPPESLNSTATDLADVQEPTRLAPYESAEAARDREQAERLVAQLLRRQIALEDRAVNLWAAEEFTAAVEQAREGDSLFREGNYLAALASYVSALEKSDALTERVDPVFEAALDAGDSALADGNSTGAQQQYELAVAIYSNSSRARQGLARAQNLDQVLQLMTDAESLLHEDQISAARDAYRKVLNLNPAWQPAINALGDLEKSLARQNFSRSMSDGFSYLAQNKLEQAKKSFQVALRLNPGSVDAKDGLHQVDEVMKLNEISRYRIQADGHAANERWERALLAYQSALKLDPNLVFGREGVTLAQKMIGVDEEFVLYTEKPERLAEDGVYQAALGFLEQVRLLPNPGPRLSSQLVQLQLQLQLARIPVKIDLVSDTMTEVFVYQIGRLGSFNNHSLELLPGRYTLIGTRDGYRDVRKQIVIRPGESPEPVLIRCEEKI